MSFDFTGGVKIGRETLPGLRFTGGPAVGEPAPDPLADVAYTDDLAEDTARELTAMESAYRDRAVAERDRFRAATDSEYWFAVCFTSREEKEAFLAEFGAAPLGDKYLDGSALAATLRRRSR